MVAGKKTGVGKIFTEDGKLHKEGIFVNDKWERDM